VGASLGGTQNGFTIDAVASGTKGHANGNLTDGDINSVGTQITAQNVTQDAARDIDPQSTQNRTRNPSSNSSSSASIEVRANYDRSHSRVDAPS
jgi:filamentous hemagglutinin